MNKLASAILIGSLAIGGAAIATADNDYRGKGEYHGKYCDKGKKHGYRFERMADELDLSETQMKQMRNIKETFKPQRQALRQKMRENRKTLRELMHADNIDQAAVNQLANAKGELVKEKILLRAQFKAEMNKVLNKEQREKMKNKRGYHGKKHYEHDDDDYRKGYKS